MEIESAGYEVLGGLLDIFYGAVEERLTGWVRGRLPDTEEDVARAEHTLVEIVTGGLAPELATAGA